MAAAEEFPFCGSVIWLTPEQGGRGTGPPVPLLSWPYYAATAFVPPHTADEDDRAGAAVGDLAI